MKEEKLKGAIEVTAVGYLISLGPPEKCSEHLLKLCLIRETGHWSIYLLDSITCRLRVVLMDSPSCIWKEQAPHTEFSVVEILKRVS